MQITDMSGKLLIAVPGMEDPNFRQSVVLICEHSEEGAFGLIVNRVLMNSFKPLLGAFDIKQSLTDMPVFYGGPVRPEQGYVIYTPFSDRYETIKIAESLGVTASRNILHDIARGKGPVNYLFALGFSGWSSNQLEEEIMADSWLIVPLQPEIIFGIPVKERWKAAALSAGIDVDRFCNKGGTA